jgi:hypothetical protein
MYEEGCDLGYVIGLNYTIEVVFYVSYAYTSIDTYTSSFTNIHTGTVYPEHTQVFHIQSLIIRASM